MQILLLIESGRANIERKTDNWCGLKYANNNIIIYNHAGMGVSLNFIAVVRTKLKKKTFFFDQSNTV